MNKVECARYTGRRSNSELHVFTDASQKAYAACAFLRTFNEKEEITLNLLRAKSGVAPIVRVTIPRLELLACLIGVRLAKSINTAIGEEIPTTYWSDSTNALWWITKEGTWTAFVQNRVQEIRSVTEVKQWRYVPGENNPADLPSRGCTLEKLLAQKWWEGPSWLKLPEEEWPSQKSFKMDSELQITEQKCLFLANFEVEKEDRSYLNYFSSYHRIVRLVAWIKRFSNYSRQNERRAGELTTEEFGEAEKTLFRVVQRTLQGHKRASLAKVVLDEDGILRVQTKITERVDDQNILYPIVLPGDHPLVQKLILEEHLKACHAGPQMMYSIVREKFWIIGMKKALRKVVYSCGRCKRYTGQPIHTNPVALPKDRVKDSTVFEVTGVDLAGPLHVRGTKVWVVLFTCAVYRAVHLELVTSLSTEAFLQALRRFIARRGRPTTIYSDNGTGFCGAHNELKKVWEGATSDCELRRIQWKFNPPTAAWWGGWWERLIRILKDLLKRTLHRAQLTYEELETVICECEAVMNARPLTYCAGESDELVPLTPALFLKPNERGNLEDVDLVEAQHLQRRVRYRAKLMQQLRERFRKEYLGCLVQEGKYGSRKKVQEGEVVLIGDDDQKRTKWPMGIITNVCPGKDGEVRCVTIKTAKGTLMRPVQRVYPLEMSSNTLPVKVVADATTVNPPVGYNKNVDPACDSEETTVTQTRRGRRVVPPRRLNI